MKTVLKLKTPISGQISTGNGLKPNEIGYLPQQTAAQKDFPASVREVIRSGCLNRCGLRPFYNKTERKLAEDNMEKLGIAPLAKRCYRELSGGQQRRALLARALCATRKMLMLDEPAAGLDPQASADMYRLIADLNGGGTTVIIISHDIATSLKYASHILHIGRQPESFFGTKAEYSTNEAGRIYVSSEGESI
jgi:zinc transport system ATP-binding protein